MLQVIQPDDAPEDPLSIPHRREALYLCGDELRTKLQPARQSTHPRETKLKPEVQQDKRGLGVWKVRVPA